MSDPVPAHPPPPRDLRHDLPAREAITYYDPLE